MYYKMMYQKFGSVELALAAYNAGPGNVSKYKGVPPFAETKRFVRGIMNEYYAQKANPDPAITKYQGGKGTVAAVNKAMAIDKENNVLKNVSLENLPIVTLSGAL